MVLRSDHSGHADRNSTQWWTWFADRAGFRYYAENGERTLADEAVETPGGALPGVAARVDI